MQIKTNLKAGARVGKCHKVVNRRGVCKYIACPYPPFKFPCHKIGSSGSMEPTGEENDMLMDAVEVED